MSEKPATKGVSIKVTPVNGDPRNVKDRSDREDGPDRRGRGTSDRSDIRKPGESSCSRSRSRSRSRTRVRPQDREKEASDEDELRDALKNANTELNKTNSEKDRYKSLYEQTSKKLSEHTKSIFDLKSQIQAMKDDNKVLKERAQRYAEENDRLAYDTSTYETNYTELKAQYENLLLRYNATNVPSLDNPMTSALGGSDRTKPPRTPSKRDSGVRGDDRDNRGRLSREEKKEQEKRERKEAERRERKEAEKEQKAEKERLSRRFEDRSTETNRRPPTRKRDSFVDPSWSSTAPLVNGGSTGTSRSTSANPSSRKYANGGMTSGRSHRPSPDMSPTHGYANVPRTSNPMSPGGMYSNPGSASGSSAVYDDEFDDGNYHPYPITR